MHWASGAKDQTVRSSVPIHQQRSRYCSSPDRVGNQKLSTSMEGEPDHVAVAAGRSWVVQSARGVETAAHD